MAPPQSPAHLPAQLRPLESLLLSAAAALSGTAPAAVPEKLPALSFHAPMLLQDLAAAESPLLAPGCSAHTPANCCSRSLGCGLCCLRQSFVCHCCVQEGGTVARAVQQLLQERQQRPPGCCLHCLKNQGGVPPAVPVGKGSGTLCKCIRLWPRLPCCSTSHSKQHMATACKSICLLVCESQPRLVHACADTCTVAHNSTGRAAQVQKLCCAGECVLATQEAGNLMAL